MKRGRHATEQIVGKLPEADEVDRPHLIEPSNLNTRRDLDAYALVYLTHA